MDSNLQNKFQVFTDGGSRGNPGKSAIAFVVYNEDGSEFFSDAEYIGITTNNVAEYSALLKALNSCLNRGVKNVVVNSDSELMVKQINKIYKVKDQKLMNLYQVVLQTIKQFNFFEIKHVRRESNKLADLLVNKILDDVEKIS
jgi:ribonuclease HI